MRYADDVRRHEGAKMNIRRIGTATALALLLSAPVAASAAESSNDYLTPPPGGVLGETLGRPTAVEGAVQSRSQTLPVTGGDTAELAAVGLGLVGLGYVLVRRTRRPSTVTA
jgi:LPXTG-motif cell wall-anchored protein